MDGSLFRVHGNPFDRTGSVMGAGFATTSPVDGTWVRLPCRTVIGRVPQFVAADGTLGALGGPVLDCPVHGPVDYAKDEALALHPGQSSQHATPPPAASRGCRRKQRTRPTPPNPHLDARQRAQAAQWLF